MKSRRRLLVVSYYFPPMGHSGVTRIAKFTRYLPQYGWDPTVLSVGDVGYFAHDYALLEEVLEAGVQVERTRTLDPLRLLRKEGAARLPSDSSRRLARNVTHAFMQPDNKIGWKRYAMKRADELMERGEFDVILATAPPFTDFLVALELQQKHGLPLVVDYRDPWTDSRNQFYATPLHRGYAGKLEETVLKNAESVIVANRRIKERLIARYPFLTHTNVHIIPGGFDPQDLRLASRYPLPKSQKMRITYSGSFDGGRTPKHFFTALARIFAKHPEMRDEIEACFIGHFPESFRKLAARLGVASSLVTPGHVEHYESVRWLMASDILWLTTRDPSTTPSVVFEYMGTRKPILALAGEGGVRQVLEGYKAATLVEPDKGEQIADALLALHGHWRAGTLPTVEAVRVDEYSQPQLVERLARVLAYALKI
jgi:glycosyltransferase involved in cell wall biosynthesis